MPSFSYGRIESNEGVRQWIGGFGGDSVWSLLQGVHKLGRPERRPVGRFAGVAGIACADARSSRVKAERVVMGLRLKRCESFVVNASALAASGRAAIEPSRTVPLPESLHAMNALHTLPPRSFRIALVAALAVALAGCGGSDRPKADLAAAQVNTIGVNAYLWRAALETVSFAPLVQADSAGGVIVTDWYVSPTNPNERVKLTVTILDTDLRADALRVAASRQLSQNGVWVDAPVQAATVQKLEDIILTRARELRRQAIAS